MTRRSTSTFTALLCVGSALVLAGCAHPNTSGAVYSANQVGREQTVRLATVESVREVEIDRGQTGVGVATGAVVGGIGGSTVGGGKGSALATVIGVVAGGIAGQAIEGQTAKQRGLEITVRLDSGELRAITQLADEPFRPGERVRLLNGAGGTRVTH